MNAPFSIAVLVSGCIVSYDGEGLLMRPGSSTATMLTSTSPTPHSPLEMATVGSTAGRASELSRDSKTSRNGTTTAAMYTETFMVGFLLKCYVYVYNTTTFFCVSIESAVTTVNSSSLSQIVFVSFSLSLIENSDDVPRPWASHSHHSHYK